MAFVGGVVQWAQRADDHVVKVTDVLGSTLAMYFLLPHITDEEAEAPRA